MHEITDYLTTGRENARTARELCEVTGLKLRDFYAQIEAARRAGVPICASKATENPGYYIAATREELAEYIRALTRQERTSRETREAIAQKVPLLPAECRERPRDPKQDKRSRTRAGAFIIRHRARRGMN